MQSHHLHHRTDKSNHLIGLKKSMLEYRQYLKRSVIASMEHRMLSILKASAVNHPPADDAHIVNLEPEDPIAENSQMEENSSINSEGGHLEDEDEGSANLLSKVCHDIKFQANLSDGFSTIDFVD